jgi:hypothetical protein
MATGTSPADVGANCPTACQIFMLALLLLLLLLLWKHLQRLPGQSPRRPASV